MSRSLVSDLRVAGWTRDDRPAAEILDCAAGSCANRGRWRRPDVRVGLCAQHAARRGDR